MTDRPLNLAVIIGSTREGRIGDKVAHWFVGEAARRDDLIIDLIDLAETDLPNRHLKDATPAVTCYRARIAAADAFVVVTPEYNHAYPASLKFAIDLGKSEWQAKAVGFVAYGGMAGGLRAVEQLRLVFAELHAVTIRDTVSFHMAWNLFDENGRPKDPTGPAAAATVMLNQLAWWARALRTAREAIPYGSA